MAWNKNESLENIRYQLQRKQPLETAILGYKNLNNPETNFETYKNFYNFVYKTELNNVNIINVLKNFKSYENFITNKSFFQKFFIKKAFYPTLSNQIKKKSTKKYTTYSAHGHYQTNSILFAILNYIAILPVFILMIIIGGISNILVGIASMLRKDT